MLLSDWYAANKGRLAAHGFDVEFLTVGDAQSLRATNDVVVFGFMAKGHLYADFNVLTSGGQEKLGRVDDPADVAAYFEHIFRDEVLTLING